ncbi:putative oxidoreductase GLYR1 homolog [Portunus trituberculatus]|uniref:putative oxidoreductase GLYR1 homolog n=1 Tax=Portunus trituberculatus TaxID=210409 RepID=UPI001E1CFB6C|nr:putative oxidoreductase GLYR1 homolog [Portunus trituberculatus]
MADTYELGDLVWAKMKGFSPWPGKVIPARENVKKPSKKHCHFIYFFGSENYAWIESANMKPYFQYKGRLMNANKTSTFKEAVECIEKYIGENNIEVPEVKEENNDANHTEKSITPSKEKKIKATPKRRPNSDASSGGSSAKRIKTDPMRLKDTLLDTSPSSHNAKARVSALLNRPVHIERPETPPLDVGSVSQTLKDKKIEPSGLKFGFLGLGIIGSGIVKNLLNSGHSVMVWNRSSEKCGDFVNAGAKEMMTPSDVIAAADITFSCVSDPQVAKNMVFGNCGVLQEMSADKGYVEMTGIDAETSQDIAEAISGRGGRYLEAQVQGSKVQAEEGTLVILAAGDRTLFDDCQSCFQAMGKNSFYLGEVGNASKMNLVLQVMSGVTLAGLAEGMALADRAGLQQKDVMEIMELTSLACPLMIEKGKAIIEGGFPTHLPLQHMQKDLRLGMLMGDTLELPLPLTAATNEVFKHAKRLGYGEHDVSSVYIRTRF